ncbi:hypothetical protein AB0M46_31550 [Dactylosporangium sp. NPDC051485]|uniref:hypothetical protein n=1 Tax=Dactylosporangium sp. NPDC051485 TaxID=3154846 RepID=UPI0034265E2D
MGDGEATWLIEGTTQTPRRALFVWLPGDPSQLELVLGAAADVLARCGEPIDLILADPPYALGHGDRRSAYQRTYARDHDQVVDGYVEVDPAAYADFTAEWVTAAAAALRPGGHLAVVTGAPAASPGPGRRRGRGPDLRELDRRAAPVRHVLHPPLRPPAPPDHAAHRRPARLRAPGLPPATGDAAGPPRRGLRRRCGPTNRCSP